MQPCFVLVAAFRIPPAGAGLQVQKAQLLTISIIALLFCFAEVLTEVYLPAIHDQTRAVNLLLFGRDIFSIHQVLNGPSVAEG
jgi:hypothetical protein